MNRTDAFEKQKITKAATKTVCCNMYFDSFGIEKLHIQNANFSDKTKIDCYLDFEEVVFIANDAGSGRLIKKLQAGEKIQYMTGSKSSKNYDGKPESRILSFGLSGDKVFINMSRGKGKLGDKGQIMPEGAPDLKIGVPMPIDKFRSMFLYANTWITAYLARYANALIREVDEERKANSNK